MPILLDYQLREQIPHNTTEFPISYFHDELATLSNLAGPLHWHPDFEIATAESGVLDYQIGQQHIILEVGDSVFVNGNILHGIRQLSGSCPDPMPNIVFSGALVAAETSNIYQKYIQPIAQCDSLPFIVFRHNDHSCQDVHSLVRDTYKQLSKKTQCYEMVVQRNISVYLSIYIAILINFKNQKLHAYKSKIKYAFKKCSHIFMNTMLELSLSKTSQMLLTSAAAKQDAVSIHIWDVRLLMHLFNTDFKWLTNY